MPRRVRPSIVAAVAALLALATAAGSEGGAKPRCFGKAATVVGKPGADYLAGTHRDDTILGLTGNDRIEARDGNDVVCGGPGNDVIVGGTGSDHLEGGPGFDICRSGEQLGTCEETRPAVPARGPVRPGSYVTDLFAPPFSIRLREGWYASGEAPTSFALFRGAGVAGEPGFLLQSSSRGQSVADVVRELASKPLLHATATSPVTVAGASGSRFEISGADARQLVRVPALTRAATLHRAFRGRIDVVEVGGQTVTIAAIAARDQFARFLPLTDAALGTMQFRR